MPASERNGSIMHLQGTLLMQNHIRFRVDPRDIRGENTACLTDA